MFFFRGRTAMLNINRSKEIWGDDAEEFRSVSTRRSFFLSLSSNLLTLLFEIPSRPDRWMDPIPSGAKDYEAVPWSNLMTFIAGARGSSRPSQLSPSLLLLTLSFPSLSLTSLHFSLRSFSGCIGYRFSLAEIKSLTFVLVRTLEFSPAEPHLEYLSKSSIVQRPRIVGREEEGYQMVLRLRALGKEEGA